MDGWDILVEKFKDYVVYKLSENTTINESYAKFYNQLSKVQDASATKRFNKYTVNAKLDGARWRRAYAYLPKKNLSSILLSLSLTFLRRGVTNIEIFSYGVFVYKC